MSIKLGLYDFFAYTLPGGAPNVGSRWKGVFQRVARGRFQLTPYGLNLACQLIGP
jgi:hypothetical protein